jgi:hypothetical protein
MSKPDDRNVDPREHSRIVVDGVANAPGRAMLRAVGFREEDFAKPQIGIASTWSMVTPCNMHIDGLAREAAAGVDESGGKSVQFNTITVSDGISQGKPGMRYSLISREVIADSIETVVGGEGFDGYDRGFAPQSLLGAIGVTSPRSCAPRCEDLLQKFTTISVHCARIPSIRAWRHRKRQLMVDLIAWFVVV